MYHAALCQTKYNYPQTNFAPIIKKPETPQENWPRYARENKWLRARIELLDEYGEAM